MSQISKETYPIFSHFSQAQSNDNEPDEPVTPVAAMVKATVLDAPYLEIMIPHMLAQARYPFSERVVVVDRRVDFSGKYRHRPRLDQQALDRILERLLDRGIIDTVCEVDMRPELRQEIMEHYFSEYAARVPTHAFSGGPIYATLFGLEAMRCDYVLQLDADVFFHTGPVSWISQALQCMRRDPHLWLMMTHPGPPAGPTGNSLGQSNARRATWDPSLGIWRFRTATTRYFLCDRRKLHHQLRPLFQSQGCAPLEQCLSDALQRNGAFRGALGNLESWHLHAWYHDDPFPQWVASLAQAVEAGHFPALQRGNYDLRLDQVQNRREWEALLESIATDYDCAESPPNGHRINIPGASQKKTLVCVPSSDITVTKQNPVRIGEPASVSMHEEDAVDLNPAGVAPFSVVIPVRNRAGQKLRNALYSLNWQSSGRPRQVLVVSHGSRHDFNQELAAICAEVTATLITVGDPTQPWNKSFALNIGIQATHPEVPFVMTMDADIILASNFVSVVLERLKRDPPALVLCQASDLPEHVSIPDTPERLIEAFDNLRTYSQPRPHSGTGGIQAARRSFFFEIRGYDEDFLWWGAMDGDIVNRAQLAGLEIEWIENQTAMLHQWHPRKYTILTSRQEIEQAKQAWQHNHQLAKSRSTTLQRNPTQWGRIRI